VLLVLIALEIPSGSSAALAPQQQGWWWQYRRVDPPVSPKAVVPNAPDTPELPPPASVPADGLYVAANPSGTEAYSALQWIIPEGASGTTLTLVAAAPLTPTTTIRLCPTTTNWHPEQAGAFRSAPLYQCAADAPVGVVPTDGSKITFTLGALGQNQLIDVALVPAANSTAFQANFNKPDDKALTVKPPAGGDTASVAGSGSAVLGNQNEATSINSALSDPQYFAALAPALSTPTGQEAIGAAPTVPFQQQPTTITPANTTASSGRDQMQTIGMFGLFALAVLFNRFRAQPVHEPKSLVRFGKHDVEDAS
jgi:hypothetical protein